ncbi:MAG: ABC transporter ATP-binding protein [Vicinamibacterales bacterium]
MATAIRMSGLGKRFTIGAREAQHDTLRDRIAAAVRRPFRRLSSGGFAASTTFWALQDITYEVPQGEIVGIIGGNGAGKSTLLKILSRITDPTTGEAVIHGRVGSLLEVGTGFHPDLTGRENVYLNGAILGMRKRDIDRKFDDIVGFSELGAFIDTPVKHYSSGMFVRLGFAVAAQMDSEILIVDEVLAVGDVQFQRKCLGTLDNVARGGRTVLFVSHNMAAIQRLCTSAVLLERGKVRFAGDVRAAVANYLGGETRGGFLAEARTGRPQILSADIEDAAGAIAGVALCTEAVACRIRFVLPQPYPGVRVGINVLSSDGVVLFSSHTGDAGLPMPGGAGDYEARVLIPANALLAGQFHVSPFLEAGGEMLDIQEPGLALSVDTGPSPLYAETTQRRGFVHVPCAWTIAPH